MKILSIKKIKSMNFAFLVIKTLNLNYKALFRMYFSLVNLLLLAF
jgi:hypothetical protein